MPAALANGLAGEVVRTFGEVRLRVFGTSMAPSILPGDLISIRRAGLREISPGEIVLFSQKGRLFVHRVVRSAERLDHVCLITRGDRLCHNDPPVSSSEFLGRVISVERGNRRIESIAQPSGRKRVIVRLLQTSDYATYAYVRLAALWGRFRSNRSSNSDPLTVIPNAARNLSEGFSLSHQQGREIPRRSVPRNDTERAVGHPERALECQV
ncbi:MAG: signal peptidase I [Acidobacteriia bacterium]|nr:signal peptidase I [Terriglobia bacterium]